MVIYNVDPLPHLPFMTMVNQLSDAIRGTLALSIATIYTLLLITKHLLHYMYMYILSIILQSHVVVLINTVILFCIIVAMQRNNSRVTT